MLPGLHGLVEPRQKARARLPERVEGAGLDQALHHAPIDEAEVDTPAEVGQALESLQIPGVTRLTLPDMMTNFRMKLWDPEQGKMVGYPRA